MKFEEKSKLMDSVCNDINKAKYLMADVAEELASGGLEKDSEWLMKMVYRLESFQNKYSTYSLYSKRKKVK